jgi:hypothetical protein
MKGLNLVTILIALVIVMGLGGLTFFRRPPNLSRPTDYPRKASRRNSLVIAVIVMIFLGMWYQKYTSGELAAEGIVGWKAVLAGIGAVIGILSVIFLLISVFRK